MQQKTARPKASSGGWRGRRKATTAASGVMTRIESMPKATEPQDVSAFIVAPRRKPKPERMKIPVVVRFCSPTSAARTPLPGQMSLQVTRHRA